MKNKVLVFLIVLLLALLAVNSFFMISENKGIISNEQSNISLIDLLKKEIGSIIHSSSDRSEGSESSSSSNSGVQVNVNQSQTQTPAESQDKCLADNNLTKNTIIFYYMDELHSNNMKSIVSNLSRYNFYWQSNIWNTSFNSCTGLSNLAVPTFICAGTKQQIVGETSKANLEAFARACYQG